MGISSTSCLHRFACIVDNKDSCLPYLLSLLLGLPSSSIYLHCTTFCNHVKDAGVNSCGSGDVANLQHIPRPLSHAPRSPCIAHRILIYALFRHYLRPMRRTLRIKRRTHARARARGTTHVAHRTGHPEGGVGPQKIAYIYSIQCAYFVSLFCPMLRRPISAGHVTQHRRKSKHVTKP